MDDLDPAALDADFRRLLGDLMELPGFTIEKPVHAVSTPPQTATEQPPILVLPPIAPLPEPAPAGQASRFADHVKRILIVDDNADYRDALRLVLGQCGYETRCAEDGDRGMSLALDALPDLVITDFNMPGMNGYELIVSLRANPETCNVPIVVFTGAENRRQLAGLDLGAARFLQKPFPNEVLLDAVCEFIGPGTGTPILPPEPGAAAPKEVADPLRQLLDETIQPAAITLEEAPAQETEEPAALDMAADTPLITEINRVLVRAVQVGASDIHFEPSEDHIAVRYRVDGALLKAGSLPGTLRSRLATRIKIMAKLVITERRLPQDGQITGVIEGKKVEFRVSTAPGVHGESIVLRILGGASVGADFAAVGLDGRDREVMERAIQAPHGLILVTGPTGSGKTTTLYTALNLLNGPDVKIVTAEDPVEHEIQGIVQVAARPAIGLTFERILRAFLRQDPDIILIGEIRDLETADIAIKAAGTGHLVLSTLHTNSAPSTITRLAQMGVPPYLIAASVRMVVAQRLARKVCIVCQEPAKLTDAEAALLTEEERAKLAKIVAGKGCHACLGTGLKGRQAIFEVMPLNTHRLRAAVQAGAGPDELGAVAAEEGMRTLRAAALDACARGAIPFSEAATFVIGD